MKIAVLNGSPKGMISVTMQYVLFLQKKFPQHEFAILSVCHDIKRLEEDEAAFGAVIRAVEAADAVLWALPVYVFLVPGPYKRFIELVFERSAHAAFREKYTAVLTTSVRVLDHAAHDYLSAICDDLAMRYFGEFSAEMYDLLKQSEQQRLVAFATQFLEAVVRRAPMAVRHEPLKPLAWEYTPGEPERKVATGGRKTLVLTDALAHQTNLQRMVARLCQAFAEPPEVINLHEVTIRAGCQGCIHCGFDNECIYREADQIYEVYQRIKAADVIVEAGAIRDRYLSARWKLFRDRGFFNNHMPILVGKQVGWLVSGPLRQLPNLRQILEASAGMQQANLAGIVTDECGDSRELDRLLDQLAERLIECAATGYIAPPTFLQKGCHKVLRDEIWSGLRVIFQADHGYYTEHGLYDFPRRSLKTRLSDAFFTLLLKMPKFRSEFCKRMRTEMVKPLAKVVEEA
jgi:multimeric flavodoxin WrbA